MKSNPYADLRIDNRADLPAPWYDYPVLQSGEYRTEILYTNGRDYVKVHIGQQDGVWVAATTWMIGGSSRGCHPGRKWGEFASEQNALLWASANCWPKRACCLRPRSDVKARFSRSDNTNLF